MDEGAYLIECWDADSARARLPRMGALFAPQPTLSTLHRLVAAVGLAATRRCMLIAEEFYKILALTSDDNSFEAHLHNGQH